jgi:hypothetical protein
MDRRKNFRNLRVFVARRVDNGFVAKKHVHLLQRLAPRFRVEEIITQRGDQVKYEEEVEKSESNVVESDWGALCKDQVQAPVGKC